VESVLRQFWLTYTLQIIPMTGARYVRTSWPAPGSPGDQDAWLTRALDVVCQTEDRMLYEAQKRTRKPDKKKGRDHVDDIE
jgi:hypothetical protein